MIERSDILIASEAVTDEADVRRVLANRVADVLARPMRSAVRVVRLVVPVGPVDPFAWLAAQPLLPRVYWEGRDDGLEVAAVGAADLLEGAAGDDYDTLRAQLDRVLAYSDEQVRYFGGFRFDRTFPPDEAWAPFGTYRFVLPRFELDRRAGEAVLVCNLLLPRDREREQEILGQIERLTLPQADLSGELPLPVARHDHPDAEGWRRNIAWALDAFGRTTLEKVVLARKAVFAFVDPLDPVLLLKGLRAATPGCFHFGFQPEPGVAFVGASPERLFRRDERGVWSEAVAGTRPRGDSDRTDAALREELLHSEKDLREHEYVRVSIRDGLSQLCDVLDVDAAATEMRLARGRHLLSRVQGTLREGVHGSEVMRALHPTPAVGGFPTAAALEAIRTLEPFDRGWYAGPLGWIGKHGAEFAVAIRSGLVRPGRLDLFSGAGIVDGSVAAWEWDEIEQKIGDFVKVLGLDVQA